MNQNSIEEKVYFAVFKERFEEAINLLKKITCPELRIQVCYNALVGFAISKAVKEYGKVTVLEDKDEYEKAKMGLGNLSPYAIIYKYPDDNVDGLEAMLNFVPEDNPIKQYYHEISNKI